MLDTSEVPTANNSYFSQDVKFIRFLLDAQMQAYVLRWRKKKQKPFRSVMEIARMREDLLQHTAGMVTMLVGLLHKAEAEGSSEFEDIDLLLAITKIQFHDCEELLTGDVRSKKPVHAARAKNAWRKIFERVRGLNFKPALKSAHSAYEKKETPTDRLVKAIDELQAWVYLISVRRVTESTRNWDEIDTNTGYSYCSEFPTLQRIADLLLRFMRNPNLIKSQILKLYVSI